MYINMILQRNNELMMYMLYVCLKEPNFRQNTFKIDRKAYWREIWLVYYSKWTLIYNSFSSGTLHLFDVRMFMYLPLALLVFAGCSFCSLGRALGVWGTLNWDRLSVDWVGIFCCWWNGVSEVCKTDCLLVGQDYVAAAGFVLSYYSHTLPKHNLCNKFVRQIVLRKLLTMILFGSLITTEIQ